MTHNNLRVGKAPLPETTRSSSGIDRLSALKVAIRNVTHSDTVTRFKVIDPPTERAAVVRGRDVSPVVEKADGGKVKNFREMPRRLFQPITHWFLTPV